jgi:aldose sugar dehydrogenase
MSINFFKLLILFGFIACSNSDNDANRVISPQEREEQLNLDVLTDREDVIWGFDFLPDNQILFTERSGSMLIYNDDTKTVTEVSGEPNVASGGEGGLMDIELHPSFESNRQVYFCYTATGRRIALGRGTLSGSQLTNVENIFESNTSNSSSIHFGCRIEFESNSTLFLSIGDQSEPSKAQDLSSHLGKLLRLNDDGTYPADNPFVTTTNALPEIWSLGHRNPQGLAIEPETNNLYASEHGPVGGDELNLITSGQNYGWPLVTRGEPEGELGESSPGYTDPLLSWSPAIAPSAIEFFKGRLYIATLRGQHIRRVDLNGSSQEILFQEAGLRFRNIKEGPDGLLYFSTDDGKLGRIIFDQQ